MNVIRFTPPGPITPSPDGAAVLFKDVEEALKDSAMLEWLLPLICGEDTVVANSRACFLGMGLAQRLDGRDLVRYAQLIEAQNLMRRTIQ